MKLTRKLFLSYLLVVAVSLLVMAISASLVAPAEFSHRMGYRSGGTPGPRGGMGGQTTTPIEEIEVGFHEAMNTALVGAGIAATLMAAVISWFFSQQIVNPIRALVKASRHIADGHYKERLSIHASDELGELTHSFNQMAETLTETEIVRQQLLGDVTHELKTPLASIKGYMEGLQDGVIPATPETFQLIHREAGRLQRLVRDLQELSRAEAGQLPIQVQNCDAPELIESAMDRLFPQFREKGITLQTNLPDNLPPLYADYERTEQVLINLLGNALQYTESGGRVTVMVSRQHRQLQFSVEDNGIGLETEDLKRVFHRFYRVDKSRSRASGGSGIGLTIARHLIEAQKGRIWAESLGLGQGSTFHFTLPINFTKTS